MQILLVQDHAQLIRVCERLATSPWVALDTEFMRESTYYAKLCLLQVATEDVVACIDPLAVDLAPLLDLLYRPTVLKVLHAGRQDLEVLHDLRRDVPRPLFDTQIAAALLGFPAQIGYANLVEALTGVKLPKLHTRTNWEARPLTEEQIRYAGDDVSYLRTVYQQLEAQLREHGRSAWLAEDCAALADPALYRNDPETAYTRINPGRGLAPAAQPLLKALAAWRERTAQKRNRPRGWIASDAALIEIARASPQDAAALGQLPHVPAALVQAQGAEILKLVQAARTAAPERIWPDAQPPAAAEQNLMRRLLERINTVAKHHGINPETLASKRTVYALTRDGGGPLANGWRYELIGRELLAMANSAKDFG